MSYINLSAVDKHNRNSQINSDLSTAAYLMIYSGWYPQSPDNTVSGGNLLVALPCSNPFGALTYFVQNAAVAAGGSGGTNGTQTVTGTTGTGTKFQASVTVSGNAITAVNSITTIGAYSALPSNLSAEPVTGASLTGATLSLAMSSVITANAITQTNASASGTAGFARLATSNTAGGAGIVDLDVGTSGTSVVINTTAIANGGPVSVTSCTVAEA